MFWLFRQLCTLIGFLVLCLAGLVMVREPASKWFLQWYIPHRTTFACHIDSVRIPLEWPMRATLSGVEIDNPSDFPQRLALRCSLATLNLAAPPWQQGRIIYTSVALQIVQLNVVRTEPGASNVRRFATAALRAGDKSEFLIQKFEIQVLDPRYAGLRRYTGIDTSGKLARIVGEIARVSSSTEWPDRP